MTKALVTAAFAALVLLFLAAPPAPAFAQGLSEAQGEAILEELKQIRLLLQRMERRGGTPAATARRRQPSPTAAVSAKDRPVLGEPDAPLTLVEFTDYQCPFCNRFFKTTLPRLKEKYIDTGQLRLVVKDLPLSFHKNAREAAQAAHCAGDQGRFWAMHDILYENAARLDAGLLPGYAEQLSLDVAAFEQCLASDRHLDDIDADSAEARRAGVTGTPTFVLGRTTDDVIEGVRIRGAKPYEAFEAEIKKLLEALEG